MPSPSRRPRRAWLPLRRILAAALPLLVATSGVAGQHTEHAHAPAPSESVPLYDNLGDHHYEIRTDAPDAQRYFDQGLRLYYGFNHPEAIRSFQKAQQLDARCAMCWWGEALARGPNINMPMDSAGGAAAYSALGRALALSEHAAPLERELIDALAARYEPVPRPQRAPLDSAYERAIGTLARQHPDDDEIGVLWAESVMDLSPWDYWADGRTLKPAMQRALARLEGALERNPNHPGACHFLIHALEEKQPERAVACADRLAALMPGVGHIQHMPGHIYIRVGRYADAIAVNEHAVHADESWIQDRRPGVTYYTAGYYPHNYDFMAFAASMAGRRETAVNAADQVAALIATDLLRAPGMTFLQHWATRHLQIAIRFGLWSEILAADPPDADLPHARGMWSYARGRALAAAGDGAGARAALADVRKAAADPTLEGARLEFNPAVTILGLAAAVLDGYAALAEGRTDEGLARLEAAVRLEDALVYGEPPEWTVPVRQELGEALLAARRPADAERAFREDLERFPENGWSLRGLARALRAQGRGAEADEVEAKLRAP